MNILTNLISLLREEAPFFLHLTAEHLLISLSAIVVASLIGVLLGIFISEYRKYAAWLLGAVNMLYTIPSIALLGFFYLHYRGRQPYRSYCIDTLCLAAYYPQYLYGHYAHQPAYYRSCRGNG